MKKTMLAVLLILALGLAFGAYVLFTPSERSRLPVALAVKNDTGEAFLAIGLYADKALLLHKAREDQAMAIFPEKWVDKDQPLHLVAIRQDGQALYSRAVSVKGISSITLREIEGSSLVLSEKTAGEAPLLPPLPKLDTWQVRQEGQHVLASFRAHTDWHYQVAVLGKGGNIGESDVSSDAQQVSASWEKGRDGRDSWLRLTR